MIYFSHMKYIISLFVALVCFVSAQTLHAVMTSTSYIILEDNFTTAEQGISTSTSFTLFDSLGDFPPGTLSGSTYTLYGGFYFPEDGSFLSLTMSTTTVDLGTLSASSVSTASATGTVTATMDTGYTLAVSEDGNLRSGANDIDDVSDGTVTAGAEEYGIQTSGADGLLVTDTAVDGSVNIATNNDAVANLPTRVDFSASIDGSTTAGSYAHQVTFTLTANP